MERSPCLTCQIHLAGFSKNNEPACNKCPAARTFSDRLLDMTCGVPIELTVLGRELYRPPLPKHSPRVISEWGRAYEAVCRICQKYHIVTRHLYKGSKTRAVSAARREIIRELTLMNVTLERIANFCGVENPTVYYHQARLGLHKRKVHNDAALPAL